MFKKKRNKKEFVPFCLHICLESITFVGRCFNASWYKVEIIKNKDKNEK